MTECICLHIIVHKHTKKKNNIWNYFYQTKDLTILLCRKHYQSHLIDDISTTELDPTFIFASLSSKSV